VAAALERLQLAAMGATSTSQRVSISLLVFFLPEAIAPLLAYGRTYGLRCGLESIALAASSFLNLSFSGSQYSVRFAFMAM
jgi:hypothetical protein